MAAAVEACYAAALQPDKWGRVCDAISALGGAIGTTLLSVTEAGKHPVQPYSELLSPLAEPYYRDGWYKRDFRMRGFPKLLSRGFIVDHDFTTTDEIAREPYYQELMIPNGFGWFGGVAFSAGETVWCAAIQRRDHPFTHEQLNPVLALVPHLNRAGAIAAALEFTQLSARAETLDRMAVGLLAFDAATRILLANRQAEALFGDVFALRDGQLRALNTSADTKLQALISAATISSRADDLSPGPAILTRPAGRPVVVEVLPLGPDIGPFSGARALLIATDLDKRLRPAAGRLKMVFGLTPAEARLASRIATGESLEEAAAVLGIVKATARVQLRSVFAKTDTCRQADLVALLTRLSAT